MSEFVSCSILHLINLRLYHTLYMYLKTYILVELNRYVNYLHLQNDSVSSSSISDVCLQCSDEYSAACRFETGLHSLAEKSDICSKNQKLFY